MEISPVSLINLKVLTRSILENLLREFRGSERENNFKVSLTVIIKRTRVTSSSAK